MYVYMCTNFAPKTQGREQKLNFKKIVIIKLQIVFIIIYKYTHTRSQRGVTEKQK